MPTEQFLNSFIINQVDTTDTLDAMDAAGLVNPNELYLVEEGDFNIVVDDQPTEGSKNLIASGAVKTYVDGVASNLVTEITPESIGAATVAQVQAAQSTADNAAQAAQNAQSTANSAATAASQAQSDATTAKANAATALNKANEASTVSPETAAALGLSTGASVNDALMELSYVANWYVWVKIASVGKCTEEEFGSGVGAFSFWYSDSGINFMYFDEMEIRSDGFVAKNPTGISINTTTVANGTLDVLKGKYVAFYSSSNTGIQVLYHFPADTTMGYYVDSNNYYITSTSGFTKYTNPVVESSVIGYAASADNNAYPQDGEQDGVYYKYVKQIGEAGAKIKTGSYKGTNAFGESNPNILSFSFAPKFAWIYAAKNESYIQPINNYGSNVTSMGFFVMEQITTSYASTYGLAPYAEGGYNKAYGKKSADGKTLYWYNNENARKQLNDGAWTYYYVAIG